MEISKHKSRIVCTAAAGIFAMTILGCGVSGVGENSFFGAGFSGDYGPPQIVGKIELPDIKESSGLSASECQDILWTHNDAGNDPLIYAMNLEGRHKGVWRLPNVRSVDWESIATFKEASGKCSLLIGDIGDNNSNRDNLVIYRIEEPAITAESSKSTPGVPLEVAKVEELKFAYPDGPKNAETLLVHPKNGLIYILTKMESGPSQIHRLEPTFGLVERVKTTKIGEINFPAKPAGLLTGGSFSPDGTRVMLCDQKNGYELVVSAGKDPEEIWHQPISVVDLGERKQGEGISYGRDGYSLYASSERKIRR